VPAHRGMKLGCLVWTFGALPASPARRMTCEPATARPAGAGRPPRPGPAALEALPADPSTRLPLPRRCVRSDLALGSRNEVMRGGHFQDPAASSNNVPLFATADSLMSPSTVGNAEEASP
jgi:hypothetical protein